MLWPPFLGYHGPEPSPWLGFGMGFYSHFPGLPRIISAGSGKSYQCVPFCCCGPRSQLIRYMHVGGVMSSLHLKYSVIFFFSYRKGVISVPQRLYLLT